MKVCMKGPDRITRLPHVQEPATLPGVPRLSSILAVLALAASAAADGPEGRPAAIEATGCPGDPIAPTQVITGEFPADLQGSYVMVPFEVPPKTTAVRVKYCWDDPEGPTVGNQRHTIDLGLWQARPKGGTWGRKQFRGWGGSSHPDVTVSRQGFSTEAEYLARPRGHVPGRTTRGFLPGKIPAGTWAAELGVGGVVAQADGDADGKVRWRVEIELSQDAAFASDPYRPARYITTPARKAAGWYAGDMHVHAEHSALGDATMSEVFDYAFRTLLDGGAGLDFVMLSDYVTSSAWGEIGRYQQRFPGKVIARSSEVITYRGHMNNHTSVRYVDHRTGPVYERDATGSLHQLRGPRPPAKIFQEVRKADGFTQINHPTIFPSSTPAFRLLCRGCPWDYDAAETGYPKVDAIEIQTGPAEIGAAPNPFTRDAIAFWEAALATGQRIAAVGSSDSHRAGRTNDATQSPIGQATTVVYAKKLSEAGVRAGVKAGNTYVKLLGNAGPDLRFEARRGSGAKKTVIMGDALAGGTAEFIAQVLNTDRSVRARTLLVLKDGRPFAEFPVGVGTTTVTFSSGGPGRYRLQLERGPLIEAVSSPIYLKP